MREQPFDPFRTRIPPSADDMNRLQEGVERATAFVPGYGVIDGTGHHAPAPPAESFWAKVYSPTGDTPHKWSWNRVIPRDDGTFDDDMSQSGDGDTLPAYEVQDRTVPDNTIVRMYPVLGRHLCEFDALTASCPSVPGAGGTMVDHLTLVGTDCSTGHDVQTDVYFGCQVRLVTTDLGAASCCTTSYTLTTGSGTRVTLNGGSSPVTVSDGSTVNLDTGADVPLLLSANAFTNTNTFKKLVQTPGGTGSVSTGGVFTDSQAATWTDSGTAASGTLAQAYLHRFSQPTLAASNTGVTVTEAATVYVPSAPAAGTNVTITKSYAALFGPTKVSSLNVNGAYNLPTADGTASYAPLTNGSGTVAWGLVLVGLGSSSPISVTGGNTPTVSHDDSGVTAATYGDPNNGTAPRVTVNAKGHITSASEQSVVISANTQISGILPSSHGGSGVNNAATWSGTYATGDGRTATVSGGLIVNVV